MAIEIPTNTALYIPVGPMLDKTDGITPELSITVANSAITLIAGAADETAPTLVLDEVAGNDATNTLVHITDDNAGMHYLKLTAANNNRYGKGMLVIEDVATYVTVFHEIQWVSAAYYAWKYGTTKPEMALADDAITAAKFDESTAFPLKSADTGSTKVARTGADSDTLEVLSDEITAMQADIGDASSSSLGSLYAILGDAAATLTSRIPSGTPGANNGATTTNGTKVNQTVDLQYILGTALTEGATGRLAAAFKKLLDIEIPVFTVASKNQTGDAHADIQTSTISEMSQGAPPATPTLIQAINYLYRKLRNKNETTVTENKVYDDAGTTVLFKETHSDSAGTFTKGKFGTGA